MLSQALDLLIEFLPWFAAVYGVNVALYFLTRWAL